MVSRIGTWRRVDVLILVVAVVAIVIRNDREISDVYQQDTVDTLSHRWPSAIRSIIRPYLRLKSGFVAALVVTTAGLGLASIRRPFVRPFKKWPGRGVSSIVIGSLAIAWSLITILPAAIADPTLNYLGFADPHLLFNGLRSCESTSKDSILGAWTLLALAGRWKSEADAFERCGRILGWCWLGTIALDLIDAALW